MMCKSATTSETAMSDFQAGSLRFKPWAGCILCGKNTPKHQFLSGDIEDIYRIRHYMFYSSRNPRKYVLQLVMPQVKLLSDHKVKITFCLTPHSTHFLLLVFFCINISIFVYVCVGGGAANKPVKIKKSSQWILIFPF